MEVQIEHISFAGLVVKNHLYSSVLDLHHECIYFKAQIKFIWAYVYIYNRLFEHRTKLFLVYMQGFQII